MDFPKLYKTNSNGKELEWSICTHYDKDWIISTVHGQIDGAMQIAETVIKKGKNIGRANETTPEQQANSEALSKWKKQLDKGYSETRGGASKTARPMLAHKYEDHRDKIVFPCFTQPKYDGCRCTAFKRDNQIILLSRGNKPFTGLNHIRKSLLLKMKEDEIIDGELYSHELKFQNITSLIKREQEDSILLEYHVYDIVLDKPYSERLKELDRFAHENIKIVTTDVCSSHDEIEQNKERYINLGYEGAMVRHGDLPYAEGSRSTQLLKVKSWQDTEFQIVDVVPGVGKMHNQGIFVCICNGICFNVRAKGEDSLREEYLKNKYKYIGKELTVKFFEWTTSENPLPRFPVGLKIKEDFE